MSYSHFQGQIAGCGIESRTTGVKGKYILLLRPFSMKIFKHGKTVQGTHTHPPLKPVITKLLQHVFYKNLAIHPFLNTSLFSPVFQNKL